MELLNERRRKLGLAEVAYSTDMAKASRDCVKNNQANGTFEHCGYEVLFASGGMTGPEEMMEAWWSSPGHKTALTQSGSRNAGPAVVPDGSGGLMAAITLDY